MAFSDGVVAIAVTVLVLPLADIDMSRFGDDPIDRIFGHYSYLMLSFVISWYVIIAFWLSHHRIFEMVGRVDSRLVMLDVFWLFGIVVFPFPASLFGQSEIGIGAQRLVASMYAGNLVLVSALTILIGRHVRKHEDLLSEYGRANRAALRTTRGWAILGVFVLFLALAQVWPGHAVYSLLLLIVAKPGSRLLDRRIFPNPPGPLPVATEIQPSVRLRIPLRAGVGRQKTASTRLGRPTRDPRP